jgi:uncharacterized protein YjiS (DUF1127 family)
MYCAHRVPFGRTDTPSRSSAAAQRRWPEWLYSIIRIWRRIQERSRQRRALLELDDHMLRDVGVSRLEAEREGRRSFWR